MSNESKEKIKQYFGTGRRKRSVARVIIRSGIGKVEINGRDIKQYFTAEFTRKQALSPLDVSRLEGRIDVRVNVFGGGLTGQAGAVRHGLSRALLEYDAGLRPDLKKSGYLTRDSRKVERKKYGLKKARRAPQFSKR
ncbi:MAG: 30S ribosomal protein S9 [Mariprofundales bacterium]